MLKHHKRSGASAPTLILIHAFPFSSAMWDELIANLADLEIGIATIDLPGYGSTPNGEWTMQSMASAMNEAFEENEITSPVLCGLSMGGYVALAYCKYHPGSFAGLVLADTRSAADSEAAQRDREAFAQDALKRGAIAGVERNLAKMTSDHTKREHPEINEQMRDWMMSADPQAIANALRAMASRPDTTNILLSINVPVLLIVGEDDPVTPPAEMEKMAALLPNATFVRIPNVSHMSVNEEPQEFAAAVREYLNAFIESSRA